MDSPQLSPMTTTMSTTPVPAPVHAKPQPRPQPKLGLRAWMESVLVECERAAAGFEADPVHDLRVAIRRCRSLADGLMAIDPDPSWKEMKKAGKKVFQSLGGLRDMQVMQQWIEKLTEKLNGADDPVAVQPGIFSPIRFQTRRPVENSLSVPQQCQRPGARV